MHEMKETRCHLRTRKDNLSRNEDQEHDLGLDHTVYQAREELTQGAVSVCRRNPTARTYFWFVTAELSMTVRQAFQSDRELDVTTAHDVLNLELGELGVEA
jgi:hypothetical protein